MKHCCVKYSTDHIQDVKSQKGVEIAQHEILQSISDGEESRRKRGGWASKNSAWMTRRNLMMDNQLIQDLDDAKEIFWYHISGILLLGNDACYSGDDFE